MRLTLAVAALLLGPLGLAAQTSVNPKAGISISDMKDATDDVNTKGRMGFQAGLDLRLGDVFFVQPGVHFQQTGLEIGGVDLDVRGFHIPAMVGIRFGNPDAALRAMGGGGLTVVTSVKDDPGNVVKDQLRERRFGAMLGVGADLGGLTVDLTGEMGLESFYRTGNDHKLRTIRLSAGIRL